MAVSSANFAVGGRQRPDGALRDAAKLAGLRHTIMVRVGPEKKFVPDRVFGIDQIISVGIKLPQRLKSV